MDDRKASQTVTLLDTYFQKIDLSLRSYASKNHVNIETSEIRFESLPVLSILAIIYSYEVSDNCATAVIKWIMGHFSGIVFRLKYAYVCPFDLSRWVTKRINFYEELYRNNCSEVIGFSLLSPPREDLARFSREELLCVAYGDVLLYPQIKKLKTTNYSNINTKYKPLFNPNNFAKFFSETIIGYLAEYIFELNQIFFTHNSVESKPHVNPSPSVSNEFTPNLYTLTKQYKEKVKDICSQYCIGSHVGFEILPILYLLTDYAAVKCDYTVQQRTDLSTRIVDEFKKHAFSAGPSEDLFWSRMDFYQSFFEGRKAKATFMFQSLSDDDLTGLSGALWAFGDILYNPSIINDYDNAPLLLRGFDQITRFQTIYRQELFPIFMEFNDKMVQYLSTVQDTFS